MWVMSKRSIPALTLSAAALLALAIPASADVVEVGKFDSTLKPACPAKPCYAISRTTGYRARSGAVRTPMVASRSGRIVAWTISLGKPTSKQIKFFETTLGGASQAQIAVLERSKSKTKRTTYSVVAIGTPVKLEPYFGRTSTFALHRSLPIQKGQVIGITVPTWAPAMASGQASDTSWRASRTKAQCEDYQAPTAQTEVKDTSVYDCLYTGTALTYSATVVPTPARNK